MSDLNHVTLIGRLTRDPELKQIGETAVARFSLAVGSSYKSNGEIKKEASFFDCEIWGKLADVLGEYASKGKQIAIAGKLKQETWDGQDGKKNSKIKIRVENFQLLGSKDGQTANSDVPTESGLPTENEQSDDDSIF